MWSSSQGKRRTLFGSLAGALVLFAALTPAPAFADGCRNPELPHKFLYSHKLDRCIRDGKTLHRVRVRGENLIRAMKKYGADVRIEESVITDGLYISDRGLQRSPNPTSLQLCRQRVFCRTLPWCEDSATCDGSPDQNSAAKEMSAPVPTITGSLTITDSTITGAGIVITGLLFDGSLVVRRSEIKGDVRLTNAIVAKSLEFGNGNTIPDGLYIGNSVIGHRFNLAESAIKHIFLKETAFAGDAVLDGAKTDQLEVWDSRFKAKASFNGMQIRKRQAFSDVQFSQTPDFTGTTLKTGDFIQDF